MKKLLNILLFFSILLTASIHAQGQDLPSACAGTIESYWVKGMSSSTFTWQITDPDNVLVPTSDYTLDNNGDTIKINWRSALKGGIYTFTVVETTSSGFVGTPYSQDIVLNSKTINIPFAGVPTSVAVCAGDTAKLDPGSYLNYLWHDNSTNRIFYTGTAGTYQVRLIQETDQSCSYNEIEAIINPLPLVWLGNDTVLFGNQTLTIDVYKPEFDFYKWSTNAITSSITIDGQSGKQNIWVLVTDKNGCVSDTSKIVVSAADYNKLRIPAAFTPNGDGINDKWYFPAPDKESGQDLYPYFEDVSVRIFNRYGQMVWNANNDFKAWDGKNSSGRELPMDSYHYIITFKVGVKSYIYKGSVTIVR